jgi:OMF family outer membrane factor
MGAAAVATMLTAPLALAQAPAAVAADVQPLGRTLTIDEALSIAHRNNRDLAQAKARVAQAHAGVLQSWAALLPQVVAQGKYTHNYKQVSLDFGAFASALNLPSSTFPPNAIIQKGEQLDGSLSATVPLVVPSAYPALKAAIALEDASRANDDVTDATVLYTTAQTYYACAGADEVVEARKHAVVLEAKALDNAKARLEAGVVNRVEVTRAELQLVRSRQAVLEAQDAAAQSYRALGTIMNVHDAIRVVGSDEPSAPAGELDALTAQALRQRPEFPALQKTMYSYDLQRQSNLWKWAPTLSAFGNARVFNYAGFSGDKYSWAVGLELDWTIYDGGLRDGQRKLALAQRDEQAAKLDLLRDQVRDDVYNADRNVRTKRSALDTAKRSVQLSKETLDLVQVQHDAGTATQLDLLQAQDNLVAAEVALAQARFDLSLGALSLERLSGAFPATLNLK